MKLEHVKSYPEDKTGVAQEIQSLAQAGGGAQVVGVYDLG